MGLTNWVVPLCFLDVLSLHMVDMEEFEDEQDDEDSWQDETDDVKLQSTVRQFSNVASDPSVSEACRWNVYKKGRAI